MRDTLLADPRDERSAWFAPGRCTMGTPAKTLIEDITIIMIIMIILVAIMILMLINGATFMI